MRTGILVAAFAFIAVAAAAKTKPSAKIAALPEGKLAGHVYINEALGITYDYPSDWSASTDPKETIDLDPDHPDGPTIQCSKVLLWLKAPSQGEGKFSGWADLIVIDPGCFTNVRFPKSAFDKQGINDAIDVILKHFKHSAFFSPYGARCQASAPGGRMQLLLTGGMTINANEIIQGHPAPAREPLEVHTSFFVVQSHGFWIARGYVADDPSEQELKFEKLSVSDSPTP
jgi:hypothetical protein